MVSSSTIVETRRSPLPEITLARFPARLDWEAPPGCPASQACLEDRGFLVRQEGPGAVAGPLRTRRGTLDTNGRSHAWRRQNERITTACICLLYTSPSPRDGLLSRMPS